MASIKPIAASSFDHAQYHLKSFNDGPTQFLRRLRPTCDALDTIGLVEQLPVMEMGRTGYSENIGAYSIASSTYFNGFSPAKVVACEPVIAGAPR